MNASKDTFISSTTHTESLAFAAMIAVLDFYSDHDVAQDLGRRGAAIRTILLETADKYDLNISTKGLNQLWSWSFDLDVALNRQLQTIVTESMLSSSILFSNRFYATLGIDPDHDDIFRRAISRAFNKISMIINTKEDPKEHIKFGLNRLGIY
jgi:glutamate-1-semialdehyde aminotransferase